MNTTLMPTRSNTLLATSIALALFVGCSAAPTKPDGAENLRSKLTQLQSNPDLATRAPLAMREAELAVSAAEITRRDKALGSHLVFIADRKIDIAKAQAESNFAVDQRKALGEERDAMRLRARTQEADAANRRASVAQADASTQKRYADEARDQAVTARGATEDAQRAADAARDQTDLARTAAADAQRDADAARDQTDLARTAAADAQRNARELQSQVDELQAKVTDRGLVVTLGDVLFASGTANLNSGASTHLSKLAAFLNKHQDRTTVIEGYTDSVGTEDYNQVLSQRRAEAVRSYLIGQGISASRLTASGKGESMPIGDNASATGRQQNRRVEVIIENQLVSSR